MLVRINYGRSKGEIQDIAREAALVMLSDGRALEAFPEPKPKPKPARS